MLSRRNLLIQRGQLLVTLEMVRTQTSQTLGVDLFNFTDSNILLFRNYGTIQCTGST
jgi:hypothetical protein